MKFGNRLQFAVGLGIMWLLGGTVWYCASMIGHAQETSPASPTEESLSASEEKKQMGQSLLRHVVLFQFKDSSSSLEIRKVVDAFHDLQKSISEIADFEHGTNNSPEGLNEGLTHCFLITFRTERERDIYLKHPAHQAFVELVQRHLHKAVVVDYWTGR